jgi:hypothetical protein
MNNNYKNKKKIQTDMKLTEDALNDLYIKVQKNIDLGVNPPKYIEIPKMLEKEVQDNLIMEQNYFLDITRNGHTRIYYNKSDFESRENNIVKHSSKVPMGEFEKAKSINRDKEEVKENKTTTEECMDLFELLQRIGLLHNNKERSCL